MIIVRVHEHDRLTTHVVRTFPCILGRSAESEVRIEDASISARHARIDQMDTGLILQDLGSTNGIVHAGRRVGEVGLDQNESVHLGDVLVELVVHEDLPRTKPNRRLDTGPELPPVRLALRTAAALQGGYVALMLSAAADRYAEFWPPDRPQEVLTDAFGVWGVLLFLAFVISLFCKLNSRKFHFHRVFTLLVVTVLAGELLATASDVVVFNLHNLPGVPVLPYVSFAVLAFGFMYQLQKYGFARWSKRVRAVVAVGFASLTVLVAFVMAMSARGHGDRTSISDLSLVVVDPRRIEARPGAVEDWLMKTTKVVDEEAARERERLAAGGQPAGPGPAESPDE